MAARLKVDLLNGMLEVEGPEDFVREIHDSFRLYATVALKFGSSGGEAIATQMSAPQEDSDVESNKRKRTPRRKRADSGDGNSGVKPSQYSPTVIKNLDLNGIKEFVSPFSLKSHPDKVLVYAIFLRDKKDISPCTADQIYTAYRFVGEKTPTAFLQAIRDASTKKDLVDYQSPNNITVTHIGDNRFLHDLQKNGSDE